MGLWLLSREVTPSELSVTSSLPTWLEFASSDQSDATSWKSEANEMGSFLLQVSKEESPIYRAARLTLFCLCNSCQTVISHADISEIIQYERLGGKTLEALNQIGKEYTTGSEVFGPGMQSVILRPMIALQNKTISENSQEMRDVLKGVRGLLFTTLNLGLTEPNAVTIKYVSNFLKLCQGLPILTDGFQDIITNLAEQNGLLTVWAQVLKQSDFHRYPRDTVYWETSTSYLGKVYLQDDRVLL